MKIYLIILIAVLVSLTSCQKIVDTNGLIDPEEKVFIRGYISPQDTVLRIHVSKIFPSIGTPLSIDDEDANIEKFLIKNATVTLSNDAGNSIGLNYDNNEYNYLTAASNLEITEGEKYYLKVTIEGAEYNAFCEIPKKIATINESVEIRTDEFGDKRALIKLSFQDILGVQNFYAVGGLVNGTYTDEGQTPEYFEYNLDFDNDEFVTDALEDGGVISVTSEDYYIYSPNLDSTNITLQVGNLEQVLFQNLNSSAINAIEEDNPFVEYAIAPNNILDNGAVGVFAGYNIAEKTIEIDL